jgi:hypothetical protein
MVQEEDHAGSQVASIGLGTLFSLEPLHGGQRDDMIENDSAEN